MRSKRIVRSILLVVAVLSLPLCCGPMLLLVGSFSPMHLVFLAEYTVVNASGETVYITPVGTLRDERYVLPQFASSLPGVPALRQADIRLDAGESVSILYDADDVVASEIAVRNTQSDYRQLEVGRGRRFYPLFGEEERAEEAVYSITAFDGLALISPQVLALAEGAKRVNRRAWAGMASWILLGFIPIGLFLAWSVPALKARREARDAQLETAAETVGGDEPVSLDVDGSETPVRQLLKTPLTKKQHLLALLLAGTPWLVGLILLVTGPGYLEPLVVAHAAQPWGWLMTAAILILSLLAYFGLRLGMALWNRPMPWGTASDLATAVLLIGGLLCAFFALYLTTIGPLMLCVSQDC